MNEILRVVNASTASLCASYGVEIDFNDAEAAIKRLFLDDKINLTINGTIYGFDEFTQILFPETNEFHDLCACAAKGESVDFNKAFNKVVDRCVYEATERMSETEIQEALDQS
jgi:hypothetical protein